MKIIQVLSLLCFFQLLNGQAPNTEVYMFDYTYKNGKLELSNFKNISENEGYDNQPSFANDTYLLFSSNRGGQTDIAQYYIPYNSKVYINYTAGSEYSPMKVPNEDAVTSIRLETDGAQKLYKYSLITADANVLIDNIIIGYQLWYDKNTIVTAALENNGLSLYVTDIRSKQNRRLDTEIGRSLQLMPNSDDICYISKKNPNNWEIRRMNLRTGKSSLITTTIKGAEDFIWLNNNTLMMGSGSKLYTNSTRSSSNWQEVHDFQRYGFGTITRMAINENIGKLVLVGEPNGAVITDPEDDSSASSGNGNNSIETSGVAAIIERHLRGYNNKDINAFMAPFSDDVQIYDYPDKLTSNGIKAVRDTYNNFFRRVKSLKAEVIERMVLGNKIVDHERVTIDGDVIYAIAIYEVTNGKISRVTYIQ